jgi:hypothetical protein
MLSVLIEEWGIDRVSKALSRLEGERALRGRTASSQQKRSRSLGTFSGIIEELHAEPSMQELLRQAASRYATRQFLPSIGDVRLFLAVQGADEIDFRDRTSAARQVLETLSKLDLESAQAVLKNSSFAGPSELAPLSSAIRSAGSQLRPDLDEGGEDSSLDEVSKGERGDQTTP